MEYAGEMSAEVSEATSGEVRECCKNFVLKVEGKNRGEEEKNPVITNRPENWRPISVQKLDLIFYTESSV